MPSPRTLLDGMTTRTSTARSEAMARIVAFGGTGYTGANVIRQAASRGHRVDSVSRMASRLVEVYGKLARLSSESGAPCRSVASARCGPRPERRALSRVRFDEIGTPAHHREHIGIAC